MIDATERAELAAAAEALLQQLIELRARFDRFLAERDATPPTVH